MELCIKQDPPGMFTRIFTGFNPCFNGTMYKTVDQMHEVHYDDSVSILVLMELCIKLYMFCSWKEYFVSFNPCFNGTMYKTFFAMNEKQFCMYVSILVLMELCIKPGGDTRKSIGNEVSILVLMELCIKQYKKLFLVPTGIRFQSLF